MAVTWISIALLALVHSAVSKYNPSKCSILEESYGLIPPPLPKDFEMKAEHVDHLQHFAAYEEIYFDYTNSRAKYKYLLNNFEFNYLFDYQTQQVVDWIKVHQGVSMKRDPVSQICNAVPMEESKHRYLFGYQDWIYQHPKMFNSFQVLRYGGQYLYAANGTERLDERNMKVNKFTGCVYDDFINSTMFNRYYFANTSALQPSGGTPSSIVTGAEKNPLSVPVTLQIDGESSVGNDVIPFNMTFSISWFKGNPEFESDTFQIPPWIYCENYRGRKEIPQLPRAFSTRLTINWFLVDMLGDLLPQTTGESYEEIYYDLDRKLARRDFTPNKLIDTDIYSRFGNYNPVRTIYDFNQGIRYSINKVSGRCYVTPILDNEFFDTEEQLLYRKLALPEEIFMMQKDDMEYKGKAFARDVECDVWTGRHYHKNYNTTFVKETYFSTDGWHENADGGVQYRFPVKNVLLRNDLDGELTEGVLAYNFLKFKNVQPKVASFDIQNCVEHINHKRFAIELMLNDENKEKIFIYKFFFLEAAQIYIANKTEVNTPLRVQRLHLRHQSISNPRVFLIFSLLDKADLPPAVVQYGKDLQSAIILLQKLVEDGKFMVEFSNPNTKEVIAVLAKTGGLYSLTASGNLTPAPLKPAKLREEKADDSVTTEGVKHVIRTGMTGGHLALLAFAMLFIGVGIGIAVMYLYLRVYGERFVDDRIQMSVATASSAASSSG